MLCTVLYQVSITGHSYSCTREESTSTDGPAISSTVSKVEVGNMLPTFLFSYQQSVLEGKHPAHCTLQKSALSGSILYSFTLQSSTALKAQGVMVVS